MDHQILDESEQPTHEGISTFQDQILAILPIPSAILSVLGSSVILYMTFSTRRQREWTTYTRLLIGLSICDIISSVSLGLAAFMRRTKSERIWAFGNEATCTAVGTLIQFSYSNLFYNTMLSCYFLATVRFRVKHTVIAKRLEPIMHFISLGYPLVTSIVGAVYGMYSETATGMGCWVNDYPRGCGDGPGQEKCRSGFIGYMFFGLPFVFSCTIIIINNVIIWLYVQKQRQPLLSRRSTRSTITSISSLFNWMKSGNRSSQLAAADENVSDVDIDESSVESSVKEYEIFDSTSVGGRKSTPTTTNNKYATPPCEIDQSQRDSSSRIYNGQMQRLRLISSQAFLFVVSYAICNAWMGLQGIAEGVVEEEEEPKLMKDIYALMVVNAVFAPLQGFFNMLVYLRPKYIKARNQFTSESRIWAFRRAVQGDKLRPKQRPAPDSRNEGLDTLPINTGIATSQLGQAGARSVEREEIADGTENAQHKELVPLPKGQTMSSLTVSLGVQEDEETAVRKTDSPRYERTAGAFEISSLSRFEFLSSLEHTGQGLEAISELTESVFDPIVFTSNPEFSDDRSSSSDGSQLESSEQRWSSFATNASPTTHIIRDNNSDRSSRFDEYRQDSIGMQSSLRLMAPRRVESGSETFEEVKEEEDDNSHHSMESDDEEEEEEIEYSLMMDAPINIPRRKLSEDKSLDSHSFHSFSSEISSSCSLISFSDLGSEFGDYDDDDDDFDDNSYWGEEAKTDDLEGSKAPVSSDAPVRAPRRKLSPKPEDVDGANPY